MKLHRILDRHVPRLIITAVLLGCVVLFTQTTSSQKPGAGLALPFEGSAAHDNAAFRVSNQTQKATAKGIFGRGAIGVFGEATSMNGIGVAGFGSLGDSSVGIDGRADNGFGVYGQSTNHIGVVGIRGKSFSDFQTRGILGTTDNAVEGVSKVAGGKGVAGVANNAANAVGIYGESADGMAGFFRGRVTVTEHILSKEIFTQKITGAAKLFRIDHPQYPAEKYLSHISVESNEMANVYSGNITLDARGTAWVILPDWFEALNEDFRYQLTCVGAFASVYVAREVANHRFQIAGGRPGLKISWQVTGIPRDVYAKANPLQVEEDKPSAERGYYLHPRHFGLPESKGIGDAARQRVERVEASLTSRRDR